MRKDGAHSRWKARSRQTGKLASWQIGKKKSALLLASSQWPVSHPHLPAGFVREEK
jgi:hypothetical protein